MHGILTRLKTPVRICAAVLAVSLATAGLAAVELRGDHPDTYVVKKGDTLWDIAGRFLKRPWLWPEIWQANPQVKNPHLIYPGDVLSLAYLNRVGVQAGPRTGNAIGAIPLSEIEPFLKDLRVMDESYRTLPYVVGIEEDQLRGVSGQVVYARGLASSDVGRRFQILRPTYKFSRLDRTMCCDIHWRKDLDFQGNVIPDGKTFWTNAITPDKGHELLGYEMQKVGVATMTRGEVGGIEASTLRVDDPIKEIREGDRIVPVDAQPYDLYFMPHPPKQTTEYGRGRIVAVADMFSTGGPRDVIAISLGAQDGIDNGTVFSLWRVGANKVDRVADRYHRGFRTEESVSDGAKVRLPDEFAGHAMVFRTFDKMAYALIMDSIKPARVGYELKHPDAAY